MLKREFLAVIGLVAVSACAVGGVGRQPAASQSISKPAPDIDVPPDDFSTTSIATENGSYIVPDGFYLTGTKPFQQSASDGSVASGTTYSFKSPLSGTDLQLVATLAAFDQPLSSLDRSSMVSSALEQYPIKEAWDERSVEVPGALTPYTNRRTAMRESGVDLTLAIGGSMLEANGRDHFLTCTFVQRGDMPDPLLLSAEDKCMQLIMALARSDGSISGGSGVSVAKRFGISSIAVLPARSKGRADKAITEVLDDLLLSEMQSQTGSGVKVIGSSDIESMFQFEEFKNAAGCDDASCAAEIAGALGVDSIMLATVGRLGKKYILSLSWIDQRKTEAINRVSEELGREAEDFNEGVAKAVAALLSGNSS
ncbi:MAG: hypothetical protein AAFP04_01080 [Myxococcota bacterium]